VIQFVGLEEIFRAFKKIREGVHDVNLQKARADAFEIFAINRVKVGSAGMSPISDASKKIAGRNHPPMWNNGYLLRNMKKKEILKQNAYEIGYFKNDKRKSPYSNLPLSTIASLQHTGFKVPLQGKKGERVRAFLAVHGIFPKKTRSYLIVTPRPFLWITADMYEASRIDDKIIDKEIEKWWNSI